MNNEETPWKRFHSEGDFLRYPNPDVIGDLIVDILDHPEPAPAIAETDKAASAWWDQTFETEEAYCGYVTLLSASLKSVDLESLLKESDKLFEVINTHLGHPMVDELDHLAILGRNTLQGGWRALPKLAQAVRNYATTNFENPRWLRPVRKMPDQSDAAVRLRKADL